eukprot:6006702-Lingulodinium_polyedra.AAC.1
MEEDAKRLKAARGNKVRRKINLCFHVFLRARGVDEEELPQRRAATNSVSQAPPAAGGDPGRVGGSCP